MVAAIITAAGKNRRMIEDLKKKGLSIKNKLLLDLDGKPIIIQTVENALNTGVNNCIIVLGHFSDDILPILNNIHDERLKVIINPYINVELSESLLNGVKGIRSDFCLCVAADQPTVSTDTLKKLVDIVIKNPESENKVAILARGKSGYLDSVKGLGMPFVCHSDILKKYLTGRTSDLNPILENMIEDRVIFYGVPPAHEHELVNINRYKDYLKILRGTGVSSHDLDHI